MISSGTRVRSPSAAKPSARDHSSISLLRRHPRPTGERLITRRSRPNQDERSAAPEGFIGIPVDYHGRSPYRARARRRGSPIAWQDKGRATGAQRAAPAREGGSHQPGSTAQEDRP